MFFSGICLVVAESLAIVALCIVGDISNKVVDDDETNTEDELESLHNKISSKRAELLVAVAAVWLAVPFCVSHIYLFGRVLESYFVATNGISSSVVYYAKWMYILCIIIGCVLFYSVTGMFGFITSYYSWEFTDTDGDTSYTGYYIQFLALRTVFAAADSSSIVNGIGSAIPFILGYLSTQSIWYRLLFIFVIVVQCYHIIMSSFDWAKSGFWSVGGYSNLLGGGWIAVCILLLCFFAYIFFFFFFFVCLFLLQKRFYFFFFRLLIFDWYLAYLFVMV